MLHQFKEKWSGDGLAEKDMTEKILESYHDVFSDIINVLLFQGRRSANNVRGVR